MRVSDLVRLVLSLNEDAPPVATSDASKQSEYGAPHGQA